MHLCEDHIPVKVKIHRPGATARQHWPPGDSARVTQDAEVVLYSPEAEHKA